MPKGATNTTMVNESQVREIANMQITHHVFKHEDVQKLPQVFKNDLATIAYLIREGRAAKQKELAPSYIIINADEDPQFLNEVIEVMKRHGKWG